MKAITLALSEVVSVTRSIVLYELQFDENSVFSRNYFDENGVKKVDYFTLMKYD